jgi:hypothetical protein
MSKFLKIPNGNYKVEVQQGGTITLDTGAEQGTVIVTGDLRVQGNTTTVESENLVVRDNIIVVNDGESGAGVTLDIAGIRVDRGSYLDAFLVFDENLTDPVDRVDSTLKPGLFKFTLDNNITKGIYINSISTGDEDLLILTGNGRTITVAGTTNYELNVTDDDDIPNKKYVDDAISSSLINATPFQIIQGELTPSRVTVRDTEISAVAESQINFLVNDISIANFYSDRAELSSIKISGTTIESLVSNQNIELIAQGTGEIVLESEAVSLSLSTSTPAAPAEGIKIYVTNNATDDTGIYFVKQDQTRDELISKNRALLYSMVI